MYKLARKLRVKFVCTSLITLMLILQRCNSSGEFLSDSDTELPCELEANTDILLRHRCQFDNSVFYFRSVEDSKIWGIDNNQQNVTRCKHCGGMWPISVDSNVIM